MASIALLMATLVPSPLYAHERERITVAVPLIKSANNRDGSGRNITIIRKVFDECGWVPEFRYFGFLDHIEQYRKSIDIDAVAMVPHGVGEIHQRSRDYISFAPGAIYRKNAGVDIRSMHDLSGLRVLAFRGAEDFIPGVKKMVPLMGLYSESVDQMVQVRALFVDRVDALISDGIIFAEYLRELRAVSTETAEQLSLGDMVFKAIFGKVWDHIDFRSEDRRNRFNVCLLAVKEKGIYRQWELDTIRPYGDFLKDYVSTD